MYRLYRALREGVHLRRSETRGLWVWTQSALSLSGSPSRCTFLFLLASPSVSLNSVARESFLLAPLAYPVKSNPILPLVSLLRRLPSRAIYLKYRAYLQTENERVSQPLPMTAIAAPETCRLPTILPIQWAIALPERSAEKRLRISHPWWNYSPRVGRWLVTRQVTFSFSFFFSFIKFFFFAFSDAFFADDTFAFLILLSLLHLLRLLLLLLLPSITLWEIIFKISPKCTHVPGALCTLGTTMQTIRLGIVAIPQSPNISAIVQL